MSIRAGLTKFHLLLAGAAALTAASAITIGLTIWWLRSDAVVDATKDNAKLATVLAHQIENSVQAIDLVLTEIRDREEFNVANASNNLDRLTRSDASYQYLLGRLSRLRQAEFVAVIDSRGAVVATTRQRQAPESIDVSDRTYFRYFKNNADRGIQISDPVRDRFKQLPVIIFSKRMNAPNGAFLGVVVAGVKLTYFQKIYESIASFTDQSLLLLHRDGTIIVSYPETSALPNGNPYGMIPERSPWYQLVAQGGGEFQSPGYFDNNIRFVAVKPLRNYPLVINVGLSKAAALATWRNQALVLGIGALLVTLCVAYLLKAQSNQYRRLATSEATADAALNNMLQGLIMFDSSNRMVVCNRRYLEMYGLSPQVVKPGSTLEQILDYRVAAGHFFSDDYKSYLTEILAAVEQGANFTKLTTLPDGRIISIANHLIAGGGWVATHEDVTAAKRAEERISYAAHHDGLTGLPNRNLFSEQLEQALKRARRGERLAVLYLDLDHLKRINDTLGHPIGDKLLKGAAERLLACVRDIDTVARLSGDEFAIIQTTLDDPSDAADLAIRVREAIHEPFDIDGHRIVVDISVGISIAPNDGTALNELLRTADIALYEAKNTGRGTYCFYQTEMNERMQNRSKLERDLRNALVAGEFELFYQPIVNLEDDKIETFEALLRWHHPERGLVSPAEFIPLAEETGLIVPLGEWVLRTACAAAAKWPNDIGVAVNVSAIQLNNKNLINVVMGAIASAGLPADRLVVEITESVFLQNTFANLATLRSLHGLGVRFSLDDFGTGYSSLGYLLSFPFSKIKIDRSFITDLAEKKESRVIVRAIADLARNLNMRVIAEGIETTEQRELAQMLGCTDIQGYLISKPQPLGEINPQFLEQMQTTDGVGQAAPQPPAAQSTDEPKRRAVFGR